MGKICPKCGALLLQKGNKLVCMEESCGYVEDASNKEAVPK